MNEIPGLPDKVSAHIADDGPDGRVYRLADLRGYTHVYDTVLVRCYDSVSYQVATLRKGGWIPLVLGKLHGGDIDYDEAVRRAVAILFGMEDHG